MNKNRKITSMEKSVDKASKMLQTPCTITEAVQIARGVAEDAITDYHRNQNNVNIAISIQIEIIKDILISSGLVTEEDFRSKYAEKVKEVQEMQKKQMEASDDSESEDIPSMKVDAGDVEVQVVSE